MRDYRRQASRLLDAVVCEAVALAFQRATRRPVTAVVTAGRAGQVQSPPAR